MFIFKNNLHKKMNRVSKTHSSLHSNACINRTGLKTDWHWRFKFLRRSSHRNPPPRNTAISPATSTVAEGRLRAEYLQLFSPIFYQAKFLGSPVDTRRPRFSKIDGKMLVYFKHSQGKRFLGGAFYYTK
jgi:hypothetical protein